MRTQERAPGTAVATFGRRGHAGLEQDALDCVAPDVVAEVVQCTADTRVAPGRIVLGHAQHELDDVGLSTGASAVALRAAVILARDQPTAPAQQRVGCDQGVELPERLASELL